MEKPPPREKFSTQTCYSTDVKYYSIDFSVQLFCLALGTNTLDNLHKDLLTWTQMDWNLVSLAMI